MPSFTPQKPYNALKTFADLTGYDTAAAFTVTGDVSVRVYAVVGAVAITSTSGTTTLQVGTTAAPGSMLGTVTIDGSNLVAGDVWVDGTSGTVDSERGDSNWVHIGNGADIILTRSVDDITAGVLTIYVEWKPLSAGATIVAV